MIWLAPVRTNQTARIISYFTVDNRETTVQSFNKWFDPNHPSPSIRYDKEYPIRNLSNMFLMYPKLLLLSEDMHCACKVAKMINIKFFLFMSLSISNNKQITTFTKEIY